MQIAVTFRHIEADEGMKEYVKGKVQRLEKYIENSQHLVECEIWVENTKGEVTTPGTALVIDDVEEADIGSIGSYNIMDWKRRGCAGVVTDAAARDTDEIALEKVPLYLRRRGRGIRPGRNEIESVNRPVSIGGVLVMPGDVVVADGDGVIVVPRAQARSVAAFARQVMENDKAGRRELYKQMRLPEDASTRK